MKSQKRGIGHENIEVALSFTTVRPGNWVYADEDGVLISETALS
jgi:regulator of ribonuclease activity A